jgi:methylenetetrahydrofolate reductase (NADPH)
MAACVKNGVAERAAILPTVCLTRAARALTFMNEHVPGITVPAATIARVSTHDDPKEESYQLVRELAAHALSLPGVAGLHITDFRHDDSVRRLTEDLAIGPRFEEQHAHSA